MQLPVTRRHSPRSRGALGGLLLLGFGAGLAAGFLAGTLLGGGGGRRVGRIVRSIHRGRETTPGRAALAARVKAALADDPALRGQSFEVVPVGRRGLALHGWVSSRSARAQARRTAQAAAGAEPVVSRLLVRGEDDSSVAPLPGDAPRSA